MVEGEVFFFCFFVVAERRETESVFVESFSLNHYFLLINNTRSHFKYNLCIFIYTILFKFVSKENTINSGSPLTVINLYYVLKEVSSY